MASVRNEIEGLTLLGGEPMDQAEALLPLLHGARSLGLSVLLFSGFTLAELRGREEPRVRDALAAVDVLVDGRYDASRPETERLWAGSTNQRFHYFTPRYSPAIERPAPGEPLRTVEVRLGADGRLSANGWPDLSGGGMSSSHQRTGSPRPSR
jgi:anaerobic ribonucleoside-triphosphate reductase activating protein